MTPGPSSTNSLFRSCVGYGDEYIIILRVIIERRLFVEKGTGLRQIKENSAPSSQLPLHGPPTMPDERSWSRRVYPTRPNCSGPSLYR